MSEYVVFVPPLYPGPDFENIFLSIIFTLCQRGKRAVGLLTGERISGRSVTSWKERKTPTSDPTLAPSSLVLSYETESSFTEIEKALRDDFDLLVLLDSDASLSIHKKILPVLWAIGINPSVFDVTRYQWITSQLRQQGILPDQLCPVLLNAGIPGGVAPSLINEKIPHVLARIPYAISETLSSDNHGRLVITHRPPSKLRDAIELFVQGILRKLSEVRNEPEEFPRHPDWPLFEEEVRGNLRTLSSDRFFRPGNRQVMEQKIDAAFQQSLSIFPNHNFEKEKLEALKKSLMDMLFGMGPLEDLMNNEAISEIMVNGPAHIYVEKHGYVSAEPTIYFSEDQITRLLERVTAWTGRRVDTARPYCDLLLPSGARLNIVIPPIALNGPCLTIRKFQSRFKSFEDLIKNGSLSAAQAEILKAAVRNRENIVVAGNSGSGKTTLLNILAGVLGEAERVITIEDVAELNLSRRHVIRLETRPKNVEGEGEISLADLVVNALRMRPDRLIVGECRGGEVIPMLQAMNTGHDGSMTTLHANSAGEALERLEGMVLMGAPHWPMAVVRKQIAAALDLIVYLKRENQNRVLTDMGRIRLEEEKLILEPLEI